ncbi:MAG: SPOR domain-containing protein [Candidatus Thiodiazotropha sp. (ex Notomyrtea botanica)]|nr:SPOR domain-containing protein [Candidatus Thiodiazotropha sp. (ex Notomyrtea botanica)]
MADYKHRAGSKKKSRGHSSCSIWFFGGAITGAFVVGLLWLKLGGDLGNATVPGVTKPSTSSTSPKSNAPKPTFEFYTILPEMEVVIPDEELMAPEATGPSSAQTEMPTPAVKDGTSYILQMGSFRKYGDADRMKAKLALIGIEAEIQKVSINNRDTFHRVRSGPYQTQRQLNAVRRLANDNNIASLVIKLKK